MTMANNRILFLLIPLKTSLYLNYYGFCISRSPSGLIIKAFITNNLPSGFSEEQRQSFITVPVSAILCQ